jgi:hypothetical protein
MNRKGITRQKEGNMRHDGKPKQGAGGRTQVINSTRFGLLAPFSEIFCFKCNFLGPDNTKASI